MAITVSPSVASVAIIVQEFTAGEVLSALQVIRANSNTDAFKATNDGNYEDSKVIGVSLTGAAIGVDLNVQTFGILNDPFFNFPINDPLFVGVNGVITNVPPSTFGEFVTTIGQSLGVGSIFINITEPIEL